MFAARVVHSDKCCYREVHECNQWVLLHLSKLQSIRLWRTQHRESWFCMRWYHAALGYNNQEDAESTNCSRAFDHATLGRTWQVQVCHCADCQREFTLVGIHAPYLWITTSGSLVTHQCELRVRRLRDLVYVALTENICWRAAAELSGSASFINAHALTPLYCSWRIQSTGASR